MPCCGQKRAALRTTRAPATGPVAARPLPPRPAVAAAHADVPIEYVEQPRIQVRGAVTGRVYQFSHRERIQLVDARDAAGLLGTSYFRRG